MKLYWDDEARDWLPQPPKKYRNLHIIGDECELKSHADGKVYTSKARYREALRARGMIEIGNERLPPPKFKPTSVEDTFRRVAWEKGAVL